MKTFLLKWTENRKKLCESATEWILLIFFKRCRKIIFWILFLFQWGKKYWRARFSVIWRKLKRFLYSFLYSNDPLAVWNVYRHFLLNWISTLVLDISSLCALYLNISSIETELDVVWTLSRYFFLHKSVIIFFLYFDFLVFPFNLTNLYLFYDAIYWCRKSCSSVDEYSKLCCGKMLKFIENVYFF